MYLRAGGGQQAVEAQQARWRQGAKISRLHAGRRRFQDITTSAANEEARAQRICAVRRRYRLSAGGDMGGQEVAHIG
jgi:hypothetical protein